MGTDQKRKANPTCSRSRLRIWWANSGNILVASSHRNGGGGAAVPDRDGCDPCTDIFDKVGAPPILTCTTCKARFMRAFEILAWLHHEPDVTRVESERVLLGMTTCFYFSRRFVAIITYDDGPSGRRERTPDSLFRRSGFPFFQTGKRLMIPYAFVLIIGKATNVNQ